MVLSRGLLCHPDSPERRRRRVYMHFQMGSLAVRVLRERIRIRAADIFVSVIIILHMSGLGARADVLQGILAYGLI